MTRSLNAEPVLELDMELGESAFWDAARDCLVWVDILRGEIHELKSGPHRVHLLPTHVGVAAPRLGGGWVPAVREGFAAFDPGGGGYRLLGAVDAPATRMNDGNVDARGRFFAGSMLDSEEPAAPAPLVTSCGFGGPGLDTLYITTARTTLHEAELAAHPPSGSLFAVQPGVAGSARRPFLG